MDYSVTHAKSLASLAGYGWQAWAKGIGRSSPADSPNPTLALSSGGSPVGASLQCGVGTGDAYPACDELKRE